MRLGNIILKRLRQEDCYELKVSQGYPERFVSKKKMLNQYNMYERLDMVIHTFGKRIGALG